MEFNKWYKNSSSDYTDGHIFTSSIRSKKYPSFFYGWTYEDGELEFREKLVDYKKIKCEQEDPPLTWAKKRVMINRVFKL